MLILFTHFKPCGLLHSSSRDFMDECATCDLSLLSGGLHFFNILFLSFLMLGAFYSPEFMVVSSGAELSTISTAYLCQTGKKYWTASCTATLVPLPTVRWVHSGTASTSSKQCRPDGSKDKLAETVSRMSEELNVVDKSLLGCWVALH